MARNKGSPHRVYVDAEFAMAMYNTGNYTIHQLGQFLGVSDGTLYYAMRDAGCKFIRKRRTEESQEEFERRSIAHKGKKLSQRQIEIIKERNSCNYNGLNGYGHTKVHNGGYLLAYVPKHPNAHKDGYVMLHTVIMEQKLGRYLNDDEVVHHINHNRKDNRIENLQLMKKKDHMSMHMKERHEQRRNATLTA